MKIKNVRSGILIIADAGMKLAPGDTVEVDALTPQMESAVKSKALAVTRNPKESKPEPKVVEKPIEASEAQKSEGSDTDEAKAEVSGAGGDASGTQGVLPETASGDLKELVPVAKAGGAKSGAK